MNNTYRADLNKADVKDTNPLAVENMHVALQSALLVRVPSDSTNHRSSSTVIVVASHEVVSNSLATPL